MSQSHHPHDADGTVSHNSEFDLHVQEPWLACWWAFVVIGYAFLLAMLCLLMTNQTFGH